MKTEQIKTIYTIPQKMSGTGSIHDIASQHFDRDIIFAKNAIYAVVRASYYGGKGYTTHKTAEATIRASKAIANYSHVIMDIRGNTYMIGVYGQLSPDGDHVYLVETEKADFKSFIKDIEI